MPESEKRSINGLIYTLTRKRVKNINVRIRRDGSVAVSAPGRCGIAQIESFLVKRMDWILTSQQKAATLQTQYLVPCAVSPQEALALFTRVSDAIFPLFAPVLAGRKPLLKVRLMKTRWGTCMPGKCQITLNLHLAEKPLPAVEYVVLHEYAHFVEANHSPAFWAVVARYMPDYKARQKLLKEV